MDPLIVLMIVVVSMLTVLLVIVGVQVILILKEVRRVLSRVNSTIDTVDKVVGNISSPFAQMGGMIEGLKGGFKVVEAFVSWLKNKEEDDEEE